MWLNPGEKDRLSPFADKAEETRANIDRVTPPPEYLKSLTPDQLNPTIGQNLFLVNQFPIKQNDSLPMKGLKGLGNFVLSLGAAPGELARHISIGTGDLLSGKGLQPIPKNTSFIGNILPKGASDKLQQFEQAYPYVGKLSNMLLETAVDPTTYIGGKTISNNIFKPDAFQLAGKDIATNKGLNNLDFSGVETLNKPKLEQRQGLSITEPILPKSSLYKTANSQIESPDFETTIDLDIPLKNGKLDLANTKKSYRTAEARIESPLPTQGNLAKLEIDPITVDENTILPDPQSKIIIGKQKEPFNFTNALKKFYNTMVNNQQEIFDLEKTTGTDIGKLASNSRNVSGVVDYNLTKAMANNEGNNVGKSLKEVAEVIPKGKEEDFWTYMSQRHNIDRAREGKNVQSNFTSEMSQEAVKRIEQEHPEYKTIGDNIVKWIDDFMETWGVDSGIVNKELYQDLRKTYPNYFPTQRDFSQLEKSIPEGLSQKFVDLTTPIKKAKGSDKDIIDPIENIMNLVNRTIRTAKYNQVGQSLLESFRKEPEKLKEIAEIIPTKEGMFSNLDNVITVLEDGKPVYIKINHKPLLDALNGLPKSINNVKYLTALTNGVKSLITQKNPIFAIMNMLRDVPTSYVYGSEKNPLKFGKDLFLAGKDIVKQSPRLQKYQALGGGGSNFFNSGDVSKSTAELMGKTSKLKNIASKPIEGIEIFNNLIETAPRLAEFNRVLDKTGDVTKALFASGEVTVNFARGGNIPKTLDKMGGMYINASVQGIDKFFRSVKDPKTALSTLAKGGVMITAPDISLYLINRDNPNYQSLDNRTKDAYFLIPNFSDKDKNGYAKTFIKIPKSRELGVLFGSLFERVLRKAEGQENAFKGFGNTVKTGFAPANPFENNLYKPAFVDVPLSNKDFADRAIVPQGMIMDKRSKYLQYDDKTTSIAKAIGKYSRSFLMPEGLSPKQIDYLVKSYTGVVGQFGIPLFTEGGNPLSILQNKFVADPVFSNQETTDFYDKLDKLYKTATDKNILEQIPSKQVTEEENVKNSIQGISSAVSKGFKQINQIQASSNSNEEKERKIRQIRLEMLDLMKKTNVAKNSAEMESLKTRAKDLFK
jgi:hypothetical protein